MRPPPDRHTTAVTHRAVQRGVLRGMGIGMAITLLLLVLMIALAPRALLPLIGPTASLVAALHWALLPVWCLAIAIGVMARHRFLHAEDIDGSGLAGSGLPGGGMTASRGMTGGSWTARIYQAILQNTLEQVVLAIPTYLIWAVTLPREWQAAVPAAAILFVVGRILFWRGYSGGAPSRALGFALTFYPTLVLALVAIVAALVGLR
ncbi:MAPEG family protein [Pigmentiphaga litoralis]|uniref:MAPEG family protein n=1 Tax=Pigmentiphaga litoralis TaxID=516702 RepID=UPI003B438095